MELMEVTTMLTEPILKIEEPKVLNKKNCLESLSPSAADEFNVAGRWTQEEHELFLHGLKLYNRQWKQIADIIKTRTVVQIRTHAQKYFQKLSKCSKGNSDDNGDADTSDLSPVVKMKTISNTPKLIKDKSPKNTVKATLLSKSLQITKTTNDGMFRNSSLYPVETFSNELSDFEWLAPSLVALDEKRDNSLAINSNINSQLGNSKHIDNDYVDFSWLVDNDFDHSNSSGSGGTSEESLSNPSEDDSSHPFDIEMLFFNSTWDTISEMPDKFIDTRKRSCSCSAYEDITCQKKRGRPSKFKRQMNDNFDDFDSKDHRVFSLVNGDTSGTADDEFNIFGLIDL